MEWKACAEGKKFKGERREGGGGWLELETHETDRWELPASLLTNALLLARQQGQQTRQSREVDDDLCLQVIPSHDVPDRPQRRRLHRRGVVHEELNQTAANTRLDHR